MSDRFAYLENETKIDRISNLPWDVLDSILVHLSLKEAARTSVLSSKWRYRWINLSQFVVDDKCLDSSVSNGTTRWAEIVKIINTVRSNHSGPIEKFTLSAYCCPDYSDLYKWIIYLTEKGIKEIIIKGFSLAAGPYKLPSSVFCCQRLSSLELFGCMLKLPTLFKGLDCLKVLKLDQVFIASDTLESLICNCPVLERLTLLDIGPLAFVRIHNPKLKCLRLKSKFKDICIEDSPHLADVDIRMIPMHGGIQDIPRRAEQGFICNLVRVLGCLDGITRLSLHGQFLEFLANRNVPQKLPTTFNYLLALDLKYVRLWCQRDIMACISILRSSPNLRDLLIMFDPSPVPHSSVMKFITGFIAAQSRCDFYLNNLKVVKINDFSNTATEWEFIKLLLAHSPVLESMTTVQFSSRGERVSESLFRQLHRASEHVKFRSIRAW